MGGLLRNKTIVVELDLVTEECCNCGIVFAMPRDFERRMRAAPGTWFYCPAGHGQAYQGTSEADKLRAQLADERRRAEPAEQRVAERDDDVRAARERAEHERRRANGFKGVAAKMTKRIKAGVCPCC